jgi:hypothetical protein
MASDSSPQHSDTLLYLIPRTAHTQKVVVDPANTDYITKHNFPGYRIPYLNPEKGVTLADDEVTRPNSPVEQDNAIDIIILQYDGPMKDPGRGFVFGRGRNTERPIDIRLEIGDPRISSSHFRIYLDTSTSNIMIANESQNGIYVNNQELFDKTRSIFDGDLIQCAAVSFEVSIPRNASNAQFFTHYFGLPRGYSTHVSTVQDSDEGNAPASASSGLFGTDFIERSLDQRHKSQNTSNDYLPSNLPVLDQLEDHITLEGGHGKGGLFEGIPESPPAKKGRGIRSRKAKSQDKPLPPKLGPAPEKTWPLIKMGGLFTSSDMEWNIRAFGKDRIIVNPDRLRSRLEKELRIPDQDLRERSISPSSDSENVHRAKPGSGRSQRMKVGQRWHFKNRKSLPVRGLNTFHRKP